VYLYSNIPPAVLCYAQLHFKNQYYGNIRKSKKDKGINWNEYFRSLGLVDKVRNIEKALKLKSKLEEANIKNII
jgi:hypothetical protein